MIKSVSAAVVLLGLPSLCAGQVYDDPSVFACEPKRVSATDTLTLRKNSALLRELAVKRPDSTMPYFLVVQAPPEEMHALMTTREFSDSSVVKISVASLAGLAWSNGATPEPIFTVPGTYTFLTSSAIESDIGGAECHVEYVGNSNDAG
jgi:hypothetical protein